MHFSFSPASRLSIAFTESESAISSNLRVFHLMADEIPKLNCLANALGAARPYTGTIAGLGTGRTAEVWLGTGRVTRGNGAFTLQNAATGPSDLISWMRAAGTIERFIVRRDIDLAGGGALTPIDFAAVEAGVPRQNLVTVAGQGTAGALIRTSYQLITRGTTATLPASVLNGTMTLASLPIGLQLASDFYVVGASIVNGSVGFGEGRNVSVRFSAPVDRTLFLGPSLPQPATDFVGAEGPTTARLSLPVQSEYAARADAIISQFFNNYSMGISMTMTRAFRGSASSWNFETPDPADLNMNATRLDPTGPATWATYASSGDYSGLYLGSLSSELTVREAYTSGTVGSAPAGAIGIERTRDILAAAGLARIR
jgi:hypothetical protein